MISSLLLMLLAAPSQSTSAPYDACMSRAETNIDFTRCGTALLRRDDAALNAAWHNIYPSLDQPEKGQLLAEQRLWIRFKEASCQFDTGFYYGREGQVIDFYICRSEIIEDRTKQLKAIGNIRGPGQ